MSVIINGSNTPTAGGITYGDGTQYATTAAGTSGQILTSAGSSAPTWSSGLTTPTLTTPTINDGYIEETATANTGATYTIDLTNGSLQVLTLTASCTYTFPTPVAGKSFMLVQKQNGTGGWSVTWPASVKWPGGTAPTITSTASKTDKFVFTAIDGSSWLGSVAGQNYTA